MRINATALTAAALTAALLSAGTARAEQSPLGVWIDHTGRGAVEIKDCNGNLCGYVAWVKDPKDAEGCGEQIIGDVKPVGGGTWDNGWIYDPDSDSKYDVELTPKGETLKVVGYAGTKWLSETMTWKRAPADLQKCTKNTQAAAPAPKDDKAAAAPAAKPAAEATSTAKSDVKPDAKVEAKPEAEANAKMPEAEFEKQAAKPEAEDDDEPEAKGAKGARKAEAGKTAAQIAEALNFRKVDGGRTCKIDVPYLDAEVSFPCED
jgi:uncharacterized protein (DUF2147 family)